MSILLEELFGKKIAEKKYKFRYRPQIKSNILAPKTLILRRKEKMNEKVFMDKLSYNGNLQTTLPFTSEAQVKKIKDYEFFAEEMRKGQSEAKTDPPSKVRKVIRLKKKIHLLTPQLSTPKLPELPSIPRPRVQKVSLGRAQTKNTSISSSSIATRADTATIKKMSSLSSISPFNALRKSRRNISTPFTRKLKRSVNQFSGKLSVTGMISRRLPQRPSPTRLERKAVYSFQQNNSATRSINFSDCVINLYS
ncbi:unnamed protein product [Moneuplotes crassus]|uniref:Uncharacterized protein n=1 Tax=Euplotes crassus TaxID=5936 RepID=A0AAD1XF19_EUPCR|nr:unnamed protein product [Moneuplotes crassus]